MGITATNKALERIGQVDPVVYNILKKCWAESFGEEVSTEEIRGRLSQVAILESDDTDVEFVVSSINMVLANR